MNNKTIKITIGSIKRLVKESFGAKQDEDLMYSQGWYPMDNRMMTWANPEYNDGEPMPRQEVLNIVRPEKSVDNFPGMG